MVSEEVMIGDPLSTSARTVHVPLKLESSSEVGGRRRPHEELTLDSQTLLERVLIEEREEGPIEFVKCCCYDEVLSFLFHFFV